MVKKQFIRDLKSGSSVYSDFAVQRKVPPIQYKNGFTFALDLTDKTGTVSLKYWGGRTREEVDQVYHSFEESDVIRVKGKASLYKDAMQISVNPPSDTIEKAYNFDKADFLRASSRDIGDMQDELWRVIQKMDDTNIRRLLSNMFDDEELLAEYSKSPAAVRYHHNYEGGLLEHVLEMVRIARSVADVHPELDGDLLVAGCILHDIGKIKTYRMDTTISFTDEGKLLDHISIGYRMVADRIDMIDAFPNPQRQKILHMILSHHGKREWGSPVEPQFPEATALHHIDNMDAKLKMAIENANS